MERALCGGERRASGHAAHRERPQWSSGQISNTAAAHLKPSGHRRKNHGGASRCHGHGCARRVRWGDASQWYLPFQPVASHRTARAQAEGGAVSLACHMLRLVLHHACKTYAWCVHGSQWCIIPLTMSLCRDPLSARAHTALRNQKRCARVAPWLQRPRPGALRGGLVLR
jgi:hypothetical protein